MTALAALVVLLMAGCQDEATSDKSNQASVGESGETPDTTEQTRGGETSVDENDQTSDATVQTLGLLTKLIENSEAILRKLAGEQEAYAKAGDAQGERLMAQAAADVRDMKSTASLLKRDIQTVDDGTSQSDESADQPPDATYQIAQEKLDAINDSTNELEKNLDEAKRCCGLPRNFLDRNLRELHTKTNSIETLTRRIEFEQPTAQPTATPTAQPTATPTAQPTASPTAQPTASPTASPTAGSTEQP